MAFGNYAPMGGYYQPPQQNPFSQLISEVNNFKKTFNGDPRAEVERMLQSGQLSQEQFDRYAQIANEARPYIK